MARVSAMMARCLALAGAGPAQLLLRAIGGMPSLGFRV